MSRMIIINQEIAFHNSTERMAFFSTNWHPTTMADFRITSVFVLTEVHQDRENKSTWTCVIPTLDSIQINSTNQDPINAPSPSSSKLRLKNLINSNFSLNRKFEQISLKTLKPSENMNTNKRDRQYNYTKPQITKLIRKTKRQN